MRSALISSAPCKCAFSAHLIQRFSSPSSFPSPLLSPSSSPFLFLFFRVDRALKRQHPLSCPSALAPIEVPYQRSSPVPSPLISVSASARLLPSLPLSLSLSPSSSLVCLCRSRTQKATPRVALTTVSTGRPLARPSQSMHSMRQRKEEDDVAQ